MRRANLCVDGACSIEVFNALKDPYRVAHGTKIPVPLPYGRARVSEKGGPIFQNMQSQYTKVLDFYNIRLTSVIALSIWRKGFSSTAKDTLVLTTDNEAEPFLWKEAATEIYSLINQVAGPAGLEFRIEIRNPRLMYQDKSEGIKIGSDIHQALLEVQPLIEAQVAKSIPLHMRRVISYRMRGPKNQHDVSNFIPTVMILVRPDSRHLWGIVENQIEAVIKSVKSCDVEISLEFGTSLLNPAVIKDMVPPMPMYFDTLPEIARNGASIGPQMMTRDAGSLGVWVWLKPNNNSVKKPCFLTCYHVVAGGERNPERREQNNKNGINFAKAAGPNPIGVNYPAPFDAAVTKENFESNTKEGNDPDQSNKKSLEVFTRYASNGIGRVEYASGVRKNQDNRRMDWALVVVNHPGDFGQNLVPLKVWRPQELFDQRLKAPKWSPGDIVSKFASPKEGDWVAKIGRSTQVTAGEVIAMKARVTFEAVDDFETDEIQVLPGYAGTNFAEGGDSGSMVVNHRGEWIGIVMAVDASDEVTYIMSVKDIMDDIKKQTNGGTIFLASD